MNSCWSNLYDRFKDRRYGTLFIITFLTSLGLLIFAGAVISIVRQSNSEETVLAFVPAMVLLIVALVWKMILLARAQRNAGTKFPPLSRDELSKARSKLVKDRKLKSL